MQTNKLFDEVWIELNEFKINIITPYQADLMTECIRDFINTGSKFNIIDKYVVNNVKKGVSNMSLYGNCSQCQVKVSFLPEVK